MTCAIAQGPRPAVGRVWRLAALIGCALALGAACGDDRDDHDRPVQTGPDSAVDQSPGQAVPPSVNDDAGARAPAQGHDAGTSVAPSDQAPWRPAPGTRWQWQLTGAIDRSLDVAMYDVDLFDVDAQVIELLHADGRVVICYFSAGSHEDWRADADDFDTNDIGAPLDEWPGERWLDIRSEALRVVMRARLTLAAERRCDGVEPDNVDGFDNDSGFPLSAADQLDYNRFLAAEAHALGLSVGLKNALSLVAALEPEFDWALNEECIAYEECDALQPFLDAGKAVFHTEYVDDRAEGPAAQARVCADVGRRGLSTLIKTWDLDAWVLPCE